MPATLFYANKQWRVPPENVREGAPRPSPNSLAEELPTVIVPLADPFAPPLAERSQSEVGVQRPIDNPLFNAEKLGEGNKRTEWRVAGGL